MNRYFLAGLAILLVAPVGFAIVDTNSNGLSDLWEKAQNNGQLLPISFDPEGDADADGWSNAREAAAGTSPFDANPPDGMIRPEITRIPAVWGDPDEDGMPDIITPEALTVSWPTLIGKQYTLLVSSTLMQGSWITVGDPFVGNGNTHEFNFQLQSDDKLFWRVAICDVDTDSDGLTNAEEHELGTDPNNPDSDGDQISDGEEVNNGMDPNVKHSDNDGVEDPYDAIPWDANAKWRLAPESRYAVIEIPLPSGADINNITVTALGPKGHVGLVNRSADIVLKSPPNFQDPWSISDTTNYVWDPSSNQTNPLPNQDANGYKFRGGITHIDEQGNAYGRGMAAQENQDPVTGIWGPMDGGPGLYQTSLEWDFPYQQPSTRMPTMLELGYFAVVGGGVRQVMDITSNTWGNSLNFLHVSANTDQGEIIRVTETDFSSTDDLHALQLSRGSIGNMTTSSELLYGDTSGCGYFCCDRAGNVIVRVKNAAGNAIYKLLPAGAGSTAVALPDTIDSVTAVIQIADADATIIPTAEVPIPPLKNQYAFVGTESGSASPGLWVQDLVTPTAWHKINERLSAPDTPVNDFSDVSGLNIRGEFLTEDGTKLFRNGKVHDFSELTDSAKWGDFHLTQINNAGMLAGTARQKDANGSLGASKAVLLMPVTIRDNHPATGVDDSSITADQQDIGYQDKFWIMAPSGNASNGSACSNAMKFVIPSNPANELEISYPQGVLAPATPTPGTVTIASSGADCAWHGESLTTTETPAVVWKIGAPGQTKTVVDLPIAVKTMKKRIVRVAVYCVAELKSNGTTYPPETLMLPTDVQLKEYLNELFAYQINTWFQVEFMPGTQNVNFGGVLNCGSDTDPSADQTAVISEFGGLNSAYDLHLFLVGVSSLVAQEARGFTCPGQATSWVFAKSSDGAYNDPNELMVTIGHEFGHVLFGKGHPDQPPYQGPAPLDGTDRLKRLMFSRNNAGSRLIVKKEWDKADEWLQGNVDLRNP